MSVETLESDAKLPTCGGCRLDERDCRYLQSKRGRKGPKKPGDPLLVSSQLDRNEIDFLDTVNENSLAVGQSISDDEVKLENLTCSVNWVHSFASISHFNEEI